MDKKVLKFVGICSVLAKILLVVYALLELAALGFLVISKFNLKVANSLGEFDILLFFTRQIFVIAIIFYLVKIFDTIKKNKKFFAYPINLWIRALAIIVLFYSTLMNMLYNFIYGILNFELKLSFILKINFTTLIIGAGLLILSFVVEHGNKLQQQDDETL